MTEAELLDHVVQRALYLDLLAFHSVDPRRDVGPGFPDLVLAGPAGVIFAELKSQHGVMSEDQRAWGQRLRAGLDLSRRAVWVLWRPADWDAGVIERYLRSIAMR